MNITRRGLSCVIGSAAVLSAVASICMMPRPAAAQAITTNAVPWYDSFETYPGAYAIVGTNGWTSGDTNAAVVTNIDYSANYTNPSGKYPLNTNGTAHTKVLKLNNAITNYVESADSEKVWIDHVIQPVFWTETNAPSVADDAQMAYYVNSNAHPVVWHGDPYAGSNWWTEIPYINIGSDDWIRVTILMDYETLDWFSFVPGGFFQVRINGQTITNAYAYLDNSYADPMDTGGSWFYRANAAPLKLISISASGTGHLDDLVVTNGDPFPPVFYDLDVDSDYGSPDPAVGTHEYSEGESETCTVNSPVTAGTTRRVCTGWTGTGSVPASGGGTSAGPFTMLEDSSITWNWKTQYYLDTGAGAGGSVDEDDQWVDSGDEVVVTATADEHYNFAGWTGDVDPGHVMDRVLTNLMDQARQITATFTPETYDLDVISPYDVVLPATGTHSYAYNTVVGLYVTNTPLVNGSTQMVATGWTGTGDVPASGSGTNTSATLTENSSITWTWKTQYLLDTEVAGDGDVDQADQWVDSGSNITIEATEGDHSHFVNWSGNVPGGSETNNPLTVTMDQARQLTANFELDQQTYQIVSDYGTPLPAVGIYTAAYGTVLSAYLTDSPLAVGTTTQRVCTGWACDGGVFAAAGAATNAGPAALTNDIVLTWQWKSQVWLDAETNGCGTVAPDDMWVDSGAAIAVTAAPCSDSYEFAAWSGDVPGGSETNNPLDVTMDRTRQLTANFDFAYAPGGTPIWWLRSHGYTTDYANAEMSDDDGDGFPARDERQTGTDPRDPNSAFRVLRLWTANGRVYVWFYGTDDGGVDTPFSMLRCVDPDLGTWVMVSTGDIVRAESGINEWDGPLPPGTDRLFYQPESSAEVPDP